MRSFWRICSLALIFFSESFPAHALSLSEYLALVEQQSPQVQISRERIAASEAKKSEPELVFTPNLFGGVNYADEKALGTNGIQQPGDSAKIFSQSLGIQKAWGTGTNTQVQHRIQRNDIEGIPGLTESFWTNQFEIRVAQDLWRNFFGRETRFQMKSAIYALEANVARESFQLKNIFVTAEKLYWQLALTRQISKSIESSLERTRGIFNYNQKRLKLNIIDRGDLLQSEAAVLQLQQLLEDSRTREKEAYRQLLLFVQNLPEDFQTDALEFDIENIELPEAWEPSSRGDLHSIELLAKAEKAQAISKSSSLYPQVNLVAAYSGNSLDNSFGAAEKEVFKDDFRKYEIGLQLQVPLYFGKLSDVRAGEFREAKSAELSYQQSRRELDQAFLNLKGQIQETINKLKFAQELEKTQRSKLKNEDSRYRQGRSSSFQLLTFDEDLASAELEALKLFAQLRALLAEIRLFKATN